eukprot:11158042-Lingulodinium_polyedra.AAC.1
MEALARRAQWAREGLHGHAGEAACSGDNLGIARYCSGTGRLEEPGIAVRRRYNTTADETATA